MQVPGVGLKLCECCMGGWVTPEQLKQELVGMLSCPGEGPISAAAAERAHVCHGRVSVGNDRYQREQRHPTSHMGNAEEKKSCLLFLSNIF